MARHARDRDRTARTSALDAQREAATCRRIIGIAHATPLERMIALLAPALPIVRTAIGRIYEVLLAADPVIAFRLRARHRIGEERTTVERDARGDRLSHLARTPDHVDSHLQRQVFIDAIELVRGFLRLDLFHQCTENQRIMSPLLHR